MKKLKKLYKKIAKIRTEGKDTKKARKKGKKLLESLKYIGELNKFAKEHKETKNSKDEDPILKLANDDDLNFQDLVDIIMESEVDCFDASQLGRGDLEKLTIDRITVTFNEPEDPYVFITSKDADMTKIKSILVEKVGSSKPVDLSNNEEE